MNMPELPAEEYWFYRVCSELTLAFLHQVNNELTGVIFTVEDIESGEIQNDALREKFRSLHESVQKVVRLIQETVEINLQGGDMLPHSYHVKALLEEELPMLRLLLAKTVTINLQESSFAHLETTLPKKEFSLLLAAAGLLLQPVNVRTTGEFQLDIALSQVDSSSDTSPILISLTPNYPLLVELLPSENHIGFAALKHRLQRFGGNLEIAHSLDTTAFSLRIVLQN